MSRRNKNLGDWGEQKGCEFLIKHTFKIVGRNYYTTDGEIDVIAVKGDDYYFIEIKTRYQGDLANNTAITLNKRQNLAKAVKIYCCKQNIVDKAMILAGLLVVIDKIQKKVSFNFSVIY